MASRRVGPGRDPSHRHRRRRVGGSGCGGGPHDRRVPGRQRRRDLHADLHLGHERRPEGGAADPPDAGVRRRDARRAVLPHVGGRVLLLDAALPQQRRCRLSRAGSSCGATLALARRFSASGFLADVRRFGATYLSYVGKPLAYVLATPEQPDDADNPLRVAFGNEASDRDIGEFGRRFGCLVADGFGSTENAVVVSRVPETPPGSIGRPADGVAVLDRETGDRVPAGGDGGERPGRQPRRLRRRARQHHRCRASSRATTTTRRRPASG